MRLHRLELTAFGPYPRHESIDFDALSADGLFLLHGDTGAGKTTLLDAVAFALFGAVPGARGEAKRLRCDYASPDLPTEVQLELTVQGHRLRLVRRPEYERPKRGGEGSTVARAKASLTWVNGSPSGQPAEGLSRIDEVNRTIGRLLGMSADQFFQVVLLPQGDFARFLRADTTERERLLERLFGTERFAVVERWFRDTRTQRGRVVEDYRQNVRELVARLAQAAEREPPESDQPVGEKWLLELRTKLATELTEADHQNRKARDEWSAAEDALVRQRELAERLRRARAAWKTLAELATQEPTRSAWTRELTEAKACAPVLVARQAAQLAAEQQAAARREVRAAGLRLREFGTHLEQDGVRYPVAELRAQASTVHQQAGGLAGLVDEAEQQDKDLRTFDELTRRQADATNRIEQLTARLADLPERLARARAELEIAVRAGERLDGLRERVAELTDASEAAARLPEIQRAANIAHADLTAAVDAHQAARDRLLDVRARRLDGMAAELAADLETGSPCPVCGSVTHPVPAVRLSEPVGDVDEAAAAHTEQNAHLRREQTARVAAEATRRLDILTTRLAGRTAEELSAALTATQTQAAQARQLAAQLAARTELVRSLETESERLLTQRSGAEHDQVAAATDRANLENVVAARADRLAEAAAGFADVAARRTHLLAVAESVDRLADAYAADQNAEHQYATCFAAATAAAEQAGFADADSAAKAARSAAEIAELEQRIAHANRLEAGARAALAEPELAALSIDLDVDPTAGVDAAQARVDECRAVAEASNAALSAARCRLSEVDTLGERLTAALARLRPAETSHAELAALTDVVNGRGQNAKQMSLRSYVLAARLAEVAVAATRRLRQMSQGRYSFVHSDAGGARGTRGGLGLDVLDDYSGRVRSAKTLSGGESFMASLSLALGLADVVAAETGGALLDTLFVDEGFGTLDPDTLDLVMNTMDELRAGGRTVGLVSHVEELRQRIPTRLRVRKARTGSTVEVVAG